jgi:putative endonuclease
MESRQQPRTERQARGARAEAAARTHLVRAGLREIAANANFRLGELDLVMLDTGGREGATLVFVEVRYRRGTRFGGGAMSVDAGKQRKLVRAAQQFLLAHPRWAQSPCRFDVVEAEGDPEDPQLRWIRDAFRADDA